MSKLPSTTCASAPALATNKVVAPEPGLDVLLVHMESFYNLNASQVNLGILSIGASLKAQGLSVMVMSTMDLCYMSNRQLHSIFSGMRPRLVGFYTLTDTIYQVANFARRIKAWSPNSYMVAGGPLASGLQGEISHYYPFDFVIKGEGEESLPQLAHCLKEGISFEAVPGLYIRHSNGSYTATLPAQPIQDLDKLPWADRDLVPRSLRLNISAGRGCPNACTFCFQAVHGKGYRFRSAENLAQEIITNLETGHYRAFDIIDDTFVADPDRAFRFCELMRDYRSRSGRDFGWYCEARVDTLDLHPDLLTALTETGLIRMQVGIESGDNDILRRYGKNLKLEALEKLVGRVGEMGNLSIYGNFIIGGPYETKETLTKSRELALRLLRLAPGLFEPTTGFLAPFPETPIKKYPERFGVSCSDTEFLTSMTLDECYCSTPELSSPEIRRQRYQFTMAIHEEMCAQVGTLPKKLIRQHYDWMRRYGTSTRWLSRIFQAMSTLNEYFTFSALPRFKELKDVPAHMLSQHTAMRCIGPLMYDTANFEDFLLTGSWEDLSISDPFEKAVYALASGKLNLLQMAQEIKKRLQLPDTPQALLKDRIVPVLQQLEDHYQVIIHE